MKNKQNDVDELQTQWFFVLVGTLAAVLFGITVNAVYDLLKIEMSPKGIAIIFGFLSLLFIGFFTFLFEHLQDMRNGNPNFKGWKLFLSFLKEVFRLGNGK